MIIIVGQAWEQEHIKMCGCKTRVCATAHALWTRASVWRWHRRDMEEHSNATVHGIVMDVSQIKLSRKNTDVKYFSGKLTLLSSRGGSTRGAGREIAPPKFLPVWKFIWKLGDIFLSCLHTWHEGGVSLHNYNNRSVSLP